jgi:peptide/nickel transport system substrate-binding protein
MPKSAVRLATGVIVAAMLMGGAVPAAIAQPQILTVVVPIEPTSLDPCDSDLSNNARVLRNNITEALVRLDPANGDVLPSLATSWSQVDELTWEFKLRDGVRFHDGSPFNAEAVAKALERVQVKELNCGQGPGFQETTFTPEVIDDTTIRITTGVPIPILPNRMALLFIDKLGAPDEPKTRAPVGTGPYELVAWNEGENVTLKAFDGYWGDKPSIDDVQIVWRTESAVRAAMVDTGEAQIAFEIAPQDATTEADLSYLNAETSLIRIDQEIPPLDDVRVRRALNLAIDRDALIGTVFHADAKKAMQPVISSVVGYNPDLPMWGYEPDEARALLQAAKADGVPVDQEIVIYGRVGLYPNSSESLEAIQSMLADVGFNARLEMLETGPWLKRLLKPWEPDRQPNLVQTQIDNTLGDAVFTLPGRFDSEGISSTLADPAFDKLLAEASAATGDTRRSLWQEAFRILSVEQVNIIPLFHMVASVRVSPSVDYVPDVQAGNEIKLSAIRFR